MEYEFQKADFVEEYKCWLHAICNNGEASERELRIKYRDQLGRGFNPEQMPQIFFADKQHPSLLGIWYTTPDSPVIEIANRAFKYIKQKIIDDPRTEKIHSSELATAINCEEEDAAIALKHLGKFNHTFASAGGLLGNRFGYSEISFGENISSCAAFLDHESVYDLMEEAYLNYANHKAVLPQTAFPFMLETTSAICPQPSPVTFIAPSRLKELRGISSKQFDLSKLIRLCEEINGAFASGYFYSVGMLLRAIIDHIPPIFRHETFAAVASSRGRTLKRSFIRLDTSLRDSADMNLHGIIRKKEPLPGEAQVNFSSELDALLCEIIHELH